MDATKDVVFITDEGVKISMSELFENEDFEPSEVAQIEALKIGERHNFWLSSWIERIK